MHYRTLGQPQKDASGRVVNAVLVLHGTTGSGAQFIRPEFAGELFGAGQLLDAATHFIVIVDNIGHGQSSKPSDGLRAEFPRYGYRDMVTAQYRLLTEGLGVNHLRLVIGTSMGGMHAWLWGEMYPDFADALMPLASLPGQISGRNRMWRRIAIDAIRNDPEWKGGRYAAQPGGLRWRLACSRWSAATRCFANALPRRVVPDRVDGDAPPHAVAPEWAGQARQRHQRVGEVQVHLAPQPGVVEHPDDQAQVGSARPSVSSRYCAVAVSRLSFSPGTRPASRRFGCIGRGRCCRR